MCAMLLLLFALVGGRALFVLEEIRQVGNGQAWLHVFPGVAAIVFLGLWLLCVSRLITVPSAFLVSLQGFRLIWSVSRGIPVDHPGTRIVLTMILFVPAAIELRRFMNSGRIVRSGLG